jgi:hypothetical protein
MWYQSHGKQSLVTLTLGGDSLLPSTQGLPFVASFEYSLYAAAFVLVKGFGEVDVPDEPAPSSAAASATAARGAAAAAAGVHVVAGAGGRLRSGAADEAREAARRRLRGAAAEVRAARMARTPPCADTLPAISPRGGARGAPVYACQHTRHERADTTNRQPTTPTTLPRTPSGPSRPTGHLLPHLAGHLAGRLSGYFRGRLRGQLSGRPAPHALPLRRLAAAAEQRGAAGRPCVAAHTLPSGSRAAHTPPPSALPGSRCRTMRCCSFHALQGCTCCGLPPNPGCRRCPV